MIRNLQYKYLENRKSSLFYFTIFTVKYFFWCYKSFIMVDKHYDRKIYSTTVRNLNFLKRSLFYFEIFNPFNTFNPFPFIISFLLFYTKCASLIEKEKKVMRKGLLILFDVKKRTTERCKHRSWVISLWRSLVPREKSSKEHSDSEGYWKLP